MSAIGAPLSRTEGRDKVTGRLRYTAEARAGGMLHGAFVPARIASGRVLSIDAAAAERAPGVAAVVTLANADRLRPVPYKPFAPAESPMGDRVGALQEDRVYFAGQHLGIVVADTPERAEAAAASVRVRYAPEPPRTDLDAAAPGAEALNADPNGKPPSYRRGDPDGAMAGAAVRVDARYATPAHYHNQMELSGTLAAWDAGGNLTVHEASQWVFGLRRALAGMFGLPEEKVRVLSPALGGAFGSKCAVWQHTAIVAMAARRVGRPVKAMLTREGMYAAIGNRGATRQRVELGADRDGRLVAIRHEGVVQSGLAGDFVEPVTKPTPMLYACPNVACDLKAARLNVVTPTFMRGPGDSTGMFALESAMDELAHALGLDPLELRLRNHADADPETGKPFSTKSLLECYRVGAERFGWARRRAEPGSMRDGRELVGFGMATATYPAMRIPAKASVTLSAADGTALVRSGTHEMGQGVRTAMEQIAADALGLPAGRVRFEGGDTRLPEASVSGGSSTTASVGTAVVDAAEKLKRRFAGNGAGPPEGEALVAAVRAAGLPWAEAVGEAGPNAQGPVSSHAFGAHFVEVRVDPGLARLRVSRHVAAFAIGRVVNRKLAESQMVGGIVMGYGQAMREAAEVDHRSGRVVNANLSHYLLPVHADVPDVEVHFVEEDDRQVSAMGAKGAGEICLVGVAPAVANAVFHATGRRARELPITPEMLL